MRAGPPPLPGMTPPDATNDDLAEFLGKKRQIEVYRGARDGEIVALEKHKVSYWLAFYGCAACAMAYAAGLMRLRGPGFSLAVAGGVIGGLWLVRRYRRLDKFATLLLTRGPR